MKLCDTCVLCQLTLRSWLWENGYHVREPSGAFDILLQVNRIEHHNSGTPKLGKDGFTAKPSVAWTASAPRLAYPSVEGFLIQGISTALFQAASARLLPVIGRLLHEEPDINAKGKPGWTVLQTATGGSFSRGRTAPPEESRRQCCCCL
jgi:hypothetical protein